ncbi:hypothetical protein CAEBREN_10206 [Caenorhabditis brenneri]|uniref:Uncharacterized protein n=1 Tax=Caenorhabditis brenneri TaxID=135651 RepID=G0NAF8_CAEBE|nr:hypothetical protein CAEBREN_10206 [Caenorhabditis brenneri]
MGRGKAFTPEQERAILEYVFNKVKNDYDFGIKSSKLTRQEDWVDLERQPDMKKSALSLESKHNKYSEFRRHLKGKIYAFDNVDPEKILVIGKQLGVMMSDEIQKAFERKHSVSITLAGGMIDS